jgi:hypothetical protein
MVTNSRSTPNRDGLGQRMTRGGRCPVCGLSADDGIALRTAVEVGALDLLSVSCADLDVYAAPTL